MDHIFFIHSEFGRHLSCLVSWLFYIVLQWILGCVYLFELWSSQGIHPQLGLPDQMIPLFFLLEGTKILYFTALPICIPSSSVQRLHILHALFSICCLETCWWWPFLLESVDNLSKILICNCLIIGLEKEMAPRSSTLAWKIPWTEEPGRLQSLGSLRVRHDWATSLSLFTFMH